MKARLAFSVLVMISALVVGFWLLEADTHAPAVGIHTNTNDTSTHSPNHSPPPKRERLTLPTPEPVRAIVELTSVAPEHRVPVTIIDDVSGEPLADTECEMWMVRRGSKIAYLDPRREPKTKTPIPVTIRKSNADGVLYLSNAVDALNHFVSENSHDIRYKEVPDEERSQALLPVPHAYAPVGELLDYIDALRANKSATVRMRKLGTVSGHATRMGEACPNTLVYAVPKGIDSEFGNITPLFSDYHQVITRNGSVTDGFIEKALRPFVERDIVPPFVTLDGVVHSAGWLEPEDTERNLANIPNALTDTNGAYELTGLLAGEYVIVCQTAHETRFVQIKLTDHVSVDFALADDRLASLSIRLIPPEGMSLAEAVDTYADIDLFPTIENEWQVQNPGNVARLSGLVVSTFVELSTEIDKPVTLSCNALKPGWWAFVFDADDNFRHQTFLKAGESQTIDMLVGEANLGSFSPAVFAGNSRVVLPYTIESTDPARRHAVDEVIAGAFPPTSPPQYRTIFRPPGEYLVEFKNGYETTVTLERGKAYLDDIHIPHGTLELDVNVPTKTQDESDLELVYIDADNFLTDSYDYGQYTTVKFPRVIDGRLKHTIDLPVGEWVLKIDGLKWTDGNPMQSVAGQFDDIVVPIKIDKSKTTHFAIGPRAISGYRHMQVDLVNFGDWLPRVTFDYLNGSLPEHFGLSPIRTIELGRSSFRETVQTWPPRIRNAFALSTKKADHTTLDVFFPDDNTRLVLTKDGNDYAAPCEDATHITVNAERLDDFGATHHTRVSFASPAEIDAAIVMGNRHGHTKILPTTSSSLRLESGEWSLFASCEINGLRHVHRSTVTIEGATQTITLTESDFTACGVLAVSISNPDDTGDNWWWWHECSYAEITLERLDDPTQRGTTQSASVGERRRMTDPTPTIVMDTLALEPGRYRITLWKGKRHESTHEVIISTGVTTDLNLTYPSR